MEGAPGLLEREAEIAAIDSLLAGAARSTRAGAAIEGPAGIGKTRLVQAAVERAEARGMLVLAATGSELESEYAFGVARQLFERPLVELRGRERARMLAGVAGNALMVLGLEPSGNAGVAAEQPEAAAHALYWLTANLAAERPLLLVVDDAHWADVPSLRFLHFLARRVSEVAVVLLVATRAPEDASPAPELAALLELLGPPLEPSALSEDAVAELVSERLGAEPDPAFVSACRRATSGNAFLLAELLRTLRAEGVAPSASAAADVLAVAPDTVRRWVATRLALLPAGATALARAVAVLGEAELPRASALAGLELAEARPLARALERASLLRGGHPLRFAHPVLAAAVAATVPAGELADAHGHAARLLAVEGDSADAVAAHLLRCAPAADRWSVEALREAAAGAAARGAPETAVAYLRRALEEPPAPEFRAPLLLELGTAETRASDFHAAIATLRLAVAADPDPHTAAALAIALSHALDFSGDFASSIDVLERARRSHPADEEGDVRAIEHHLLAQALLDPAWRGEVSAWLGALRAEVQAGTLGDPVLVALAGASAMGEGLPAGEWLQYVKDAAADLRLRPYETPVDVNGWAHNWAVIALDWSDCLEEADGHFDFALAESRRRCDAPRAALFLAYRARLAYREGRLRDAESHCRASEELTRGLEHNTTFPYSLIDILAEQGSFEEAERLLATVPRQGAPQQLAIVALMRGRVALAAGRNEEALGLLLDTGERLESLELRHPNLVPWRELAAEAALGLDRAELARELAAADLELCRRIGVASALGRSLRLAARVEPDPERGRALLEQSCATLAESPARLDYAYAVVDLGARLLRDGQAAEARERLRQGLELAYRCGGRVLVDRARRELVAAGGRPRRPVSTGLDALTPSELQVARLAAEGLTNREIAQALFVTLKTVEQHLSRTYTKLAITGRPELANALEPRGREASVPS